MALPKICGLETEYGIAHRGVADPNPITASSLLISSYLQRPRGDGLDLAVPRVGWDFEDEHPDVDARGIAPLGSLAPSVETHLVNLVLTNGARYYVDHAHPEMSTPECTNARDVVLWDRAGEEIVRQSMLLASDRLSPGEELVVYKNNSDRKGNSYGCHENYLMDRAIPFDRVSVHATTHLVTRQIYTGAGKVGAEVGGAGSETVDFQLTQRADFFEEHIGLETTLKRPIINTRDEPHADPRKYRRLHVITGDANLSEWSTWLKVGTTLLILGMIEDDFLPNPIVFDDPVRSLRRVSYDRSLTEPLPLTDGKKMTAIEIQWQLQERAVRYLDERGDEGVGGPDALAVAKAWGETLNKLESDPASLHDRLDWVAKYRLFDGYRERHSLEWDDARLAAMDLQYHDLRPEKSLFTRLSFGHLVSDREVRAATTNPPEDTRAWFRGECLRRWPAAVVSANWDSLVLDLGDEPLRRVPMLEPLRGTRDLIGDLLDQSAGPREFLSAIDPART